MNFKRTLSAILAGLLLAGSLTACATGDDTPEDTKSTAQTTAPVGEGETELSDNLPDDLNFGGAAFLIHKNTQKDASLDVPASSPRGIVRREEAGIGWRVPSADDEFFIRLRRFLHHRAVLRRSFFFLDFVRRFRERCRPGVFLFFRGRLGLRRFLFRLSFC